MTKTQIAKCVAQAIENCGGGINGAKWMRGHYMMRARKQRHEPAERDVWLAFAREAHRVAIALLTVTLPHDAAQEIAL